MRPIDDKIMDLFKRTRDGELSPDEAFSMYSRLRHVDEYDRAREEGRRCDECTRLFREGKK